MAGNEADVSNHRLEEHKEDELQTFPGEDIDVSLSSRVSSGEKSQVNFNGGHESNSMKESSEYTNPIMLDGEREFENTIGSSVDRDRVDICDEQEGQSPEIDNEDDPDSHTPRSPPLDLSETETLKDDNGTDVVPKLGLEFESEEQAYKCYSRYAVLEGFSIRKDFVNKSRITGAVVSRRFTCFKQGYRPNKREANLRKPRQETRTGCLAHMTIVCQPNGKFRVTHFENKHNHEFVTPCTVHMLPSQKRLTFAQAVETDLSKGSITDGTPKLGMGFNSEDHAYEFYNTYAGRVGFSVRKDYVNRSKIDGAVASRRFTCFREGFRKKGKLESSIKRPRKETRIGCMGQLVIARQSDGKYRVTHFEEKHNHELVAACRVPLLRSQKRLAGGQVSKDYVADDPGMQIHPISENIYKPAGEQGSLGYNPIDFESKLPSKCMKIMSEGEADSVIHYLQSKQLKYPSVFYAVQLDAEDQITNIFWADPKMMVDYSDFGDVVCFDTTHQMDKDCRLFVSLIGVNHHMQVLIFGAALLHDETVDSFKWLFRIFVEAMSGKKPKTILTDRVPTMVEAIGSVFPETCHRVCAWQVYQNAVKHLSHLCLVSSSFANDFCSCILYNEEEDFINAWKVMLDTYCLWENEWLHEIFEEREKWSIAYGKQIFCADLLSAQLRENFQQKMRKYLRTDLNVLQIFKQLGKMVNDWSFKEIEANYNMNHGTPRLMGDIIMLKHASDAYTPKMFELFQQEYEKCLNIVVNQCTETAPVFEYKVSAYEQTREYRVIFNSTDNSIVCSCMKFEFMGLLCSHALKALDYRNIKMVPSSYILKRWTKDARV